MKITRSKIRRVVQKINRFFVCGALFATFYFIVLVNQADDLLSLGNYAFQMAATTLLTVVITSLDPKRGENLSKIVNVAADHPKVQKVLVLWNTPDEPIPNQLKALNHTPGSRGSKRAHVEVVQSQSKSLNNRYDPSLPIHTGAVLVLDDDLEIKPETITCALDAYKKDPTRIHSFGKPRHVTRTEYTVNGTLNFLLPRMIFHKSNMAVYYEAQYDKLREYVDTQKGHCDDIAFAAVVTRHTNKSMVKINAFVKDNLRLARKGLTSAPKRDDDRVECARDILNMLEWDLPTIKYRKCESTRQRRRAWLLQRRRKLLSSHSEIHDSS